MRRIRSHLRPAPLIFAAVLAAAAVAPPASASITADGFFEADAASALYARLVDGSRAVITRIASVSPAAMIADLKIVDKLGNARVIAGVALRPVASQAAALGRMILSRRLLVPAVIAAALFETASSKLQAAHPGAVIADDGTPRISVDAGVSVVTCGSTYVKVPATGTTSPTVSAFGYLPCAYVSTGPTRLILRVPVNSAWQPSTDWLTAYGAYAVKTRTDPYVLQGGTTADTKTGFYEYTRPQTSTAIDVPTSTVSDMAEADQASLVMDPDIVGPLAQAGALPADLWQPVDATAVSTADNTTDAGSSLADGPSMGDVSSSAFNVMSYVPGLSVRWLPRSCPTWPPIKIDLPSLHLVGSFDWPNDRICAVATSYISPVMQIAGLVLFLGVVFRKFAGGE